MEHAPWLKDLLVFLVAAGLIVPLFYRARIGAVLGFLLVGIAVGPYGLGQWVGAHPWLRYLTIEDRAAVEPFAELGVMFLLFLVGLELSIARLWSLRRYVMGIGGLQFILSAVAIAAVMAGTGIGGSAAIVLGLCLAMSSTAIVMQVLEEQGRSATALGQIALSVLLFQDLMVAPVLFGAQVLSRGGDNIVLGLAGALAQAVLAVTAIAVVGRYVLRPIFRFAAQTGSRELIMAMTLLMVIALAGATGYAGLSTALGAFLAGLLLSETEYRHQVEIDLAPFKGSPGRPVLHHGRHDDRPARDLERDRRHLLCGHRIAGDQSRHLVCGQPRVRRRLGRRGRGRDPCWRRPASLPSSSLASAAPPASCPAR